MNKKQLWNEVQEARANLKSDSYFMSIGEIISLYQDEDLVLPPADNWDNNRQTKLIESILMGIPLRDILVEQNSDGLWTVVKGVQPISPILKFTGDLKGSEPLTLGKSEYLPSLQGYRWGDFPLELKRIFRRAKVQVNIILGESEVLNQYLCLQELNGYRHKNSE